MDTKNGINRETQFALMSAGAAGLVSVALIYFFIDMLTWHFIPCVMVMVFISAYFAFRRRASGKGELTSRRITNVALEVGLLTHFYTFALYLPVMYFSQGSQAIDLELFGMWILFTGIAGLISLLMFVWIAVPIYMGIGHIQKALEKGQYGENRILDESILDDVLMSPKITNETV